MRPILLSTAIGLLTCTSCKSPPLPDNRAEAETAQLVQTLSKQDLITASSNWPVTSKSGAKGGQGLTGIPQNLPPLGGDLPHFFLSHAPGSRDFWILKMEGPAGASTWYGPLRLDVNGKVVPAENGR
jgi:hypothetical protein